MKNSKGIWITNVLTCANLIRSRLCGSMILRFPSLKSSYYGWSLLRHGYKCLIFIAWIRWAWLSANLITISPLGEKLHPQVSMKITTPYIPNTMEHQLWLSIPYVGTFGLCLNSIVLCNPEVECHTSIQAREPAFV